MPPRHFVLCIAWKEREYAWQKTAIAKSKIILQSLESIPVGGAAKLEKVPDRGLNQLEGGRSVANQLNCLYCHLRPKRAQQGLPDHPFSMDIPSVLCVVLRS